MGFLLFSILFVLAVATLVIARSRLIQKRQQSNTQWSPSEEKTKSGIHPTSTIPVSPPQTPLVKVTEPIHIEPLSDFDWTTVEPEKHRPFKPTYHITMGTSPVPFNPLYPLTIPALRACTPSDLILIDKNYLSRITSRQSIVRDHESTVLGFIPEGIPAIYETYT